jgi:hypothetical protein
VILDTDGHRAVVWTWSGRREELRAGDGRRLHHEDHDDSKTTMKRK